MLTSKRFLCYFSASLAVMILVNLFPYWVTRNDPAVDGIRFAGWPFPFYSYGGIPRYGASEQPFQSVSLIRDIVIGLTASIVMGIIGFKTHQSK